MKVCLAQLPDALEFAEESLDVRFSRGTTTWIASRFDDGSLAGVAVFTQPNQGNRSLHIASKASKWFTPEFCRQMFCLGFAPQEVRRITATILLNNTQCIRLALKTGFMLEGRMRGFERGDLLIFGMLKGECKWVL